MLYAALDVGGTFIKYQLINDKMESVSSVSMQPVRSLGNREEILDAFRQVVQNIMNVSNDSGETLSGICISICGPMDYANGIFLMTEDKYAAVYGINLKDEIRNMISADIPVSTVHDVQAFLRGSSVCDPSLRTGKIMAITLGTGIGSAFMKDNEIQSPADGIIPDKALGRHKFDSDQKVENIIGGEALRLSYQNGKYSVKEIAQRACAGDGDALAVFKRLGSVLGKAAFHFTSRFEPDKIILGGQIAQSSELFLPYLSEYIHVPVLISENIGTSSMLGAVVLSSGYCSTR